MNKLACLATTLISLVCACVSDPAPLDLAINAVRSLKDGHPHSVNIQLVFYDNNLQVHEEIQFPPLIHTLGTGFALSQQRSTIVTAGHVIRTFNETSQNFSRSGFYLALKFIFVPRRDFVSAKPLRQEILAWDESNLPPNYQAKSAVTFGTLIHSDNISKDVSHERPIEEAYGAILSNVDVGLFRLSVPIEKAVNQTTNRADIQIAKEVYLPNDAPWPQGEGKWMYVDGAMDNSDGSIRPRPEEKPIGRGHVYVAAKYTERHIETHARGKCPNPYDPNQVHSCTASIAQFSLGDSGGPIYRMNAAVDGDMFTYALVSELVVSKINVVCAAGTNPNFRKLVAGLFEYLSDQKISCDRIAGDDEVIVSNYNMRLDDQAFGTDRGQSVRDWIFANAR